MSEIVMITSGKGGVGKTTATAFLGAKLSQMKKSVVLIDTDFGLRNLDIQFSIEDKIIYNIVDVLENTCSLQQALISLNDQQTLYILPGSKDYKYKLKQKDFIFILEKLTKQFDYIIIDTAAGILESHLLMIPCVTQIIIVSSLSDASIRDAITMHSVIKQHHGSAKLLINQMEQINRKQIDILKIGNDVFHMDTLGVFPCIAAKNNFQRKKIDKELYKLCNQL